MRYIYDMQKTKNKFEAWWKGTNTGRPLMKVIAEKKVITCDLEPENAFIDAEDFHLNVDENIKRYRNYLKTHSFLAESFPNFDLNLGAGSMAVYLGTEPEFRMDTIWFRECVHGTIKDIGTLSYDPENHWWKRHLSLIKRAVELSDGGFIINIPDIVENIDTLAALRGPQDLCYDIADEPATVKHYIEQRDGLYFRYYDAMYDIVSSKDGSSSYTAFNIWGPGKTAKVQCDFCALMSPIQFRYLVQDSLRKQCRLLDNSMFHLDGPDALKHLDAVLEIKELDAIQWTPGAGRPDGGNDIWYPIYDKVRASGKSIWIMLDDGTATDWINASSGLINRYGTAGLYIIYPVMDEEDASFLMETAEKYWV
jgi:hypothetical protein